MVKYFRFREERQRERERERENEERQEAVVAQVGFKDRDNMLALMPIMTNSLTRDNDNGENNVKSESSIEVVRYKQTLTETPA